MARKKIDWPEKFEAFHRANPQVYTEFKDLTLQVIHLGKKVGAELIAEVIRWNALMKTDSDDGFKLNQNFTAFYSRLFIHDHPERAGFFEWRHSVADDWAKAKWAQA